MVPTRILPISGLWNYTLHAAAGLLVGATMTVMASSPSYAGFGPPPAEYEVHSRVDTIVTSSGGMSTYNYTVNNTSVDIGGVLAVTALVGGGPTTVNAIPYIVDWELPYFPDANIDTMNIGSPSGWSWALETVGIPKAATGWDGMASWQDPLDPFYPGAGSPFLASDLQVIHWYSDAWVASLGGMPDLTDAIEPGEFLAGFSIISPFGTPVDAPYQASWDFLEVISGDPPAPGSVNAGLPGSPTLLKVPEPAIMALFGVGLAGLALTRRRRKA